MAERFKKIFKTIGIIAAGVALVVLMELCEMLIPECIYEASDYRRMFVHYNETLPSTEIELPYSIRDYKKYDDLMLWYFDELTAKVKENKPGKDFWVYQDNYDVLFGSDSNLYIRKGSAFTSDITADMVSEIAFSDNRFDEHPINIVPDFTTEEITQLAEIILSDSVPTEKIREEKYVSYADDGLRVSWDIVFKLKSTDEFCYDGLSVIFKDYWLIQDGEGNWYLYDFNDYYKALPHTLADKIEQCCNGENLILEP